MSAVTSVLRGSCYLDFECGQPEEIYHLVESWDNCKGNDDISQNYSRTFSCFFTSVEQELITMVLKKSNIAVTVSPKKMYGDSLKLILVYRR